MARQLADETGESITTAITVAVQERLDRLHGGAPREQRRNEWTRIAKRSAKRRVRDPRSPEQIVGYDRAGLPS